MQLAQCSACFHLSIKSSPKNKNAMQNSVDITESPTQATENENSISQDAPVWLTKDYMEKCLQTYYKDSKLRVQYMDVRPALAKGENYCAVLTRLKAQFTTGAGVSKTGHYIVKSTFEADDFARKLMEPYKIETKEMDIYKKVIPKLNALLQEIGDNDQLFAETIAVDYDRFALIFEDLSVKDFATRDRLQGLDMELAKLALRKLAKMHATSAVLNEREPGCLESYDRGMFNRHTENFAGCYLGLLAACSRRVKQWEEFKHYGEKLHELRTVFMKYAARAFDPVKGHVNVLAHGDFWTCNVMIKCCKKTGKPLDLIIIDFQFSAWSTPAVDLHHLLNTSVKEELQYEMQDALIQYYYHIFADTLLKLAYKSKIPTLHEFHIQVEEKAFYGLITTICNATVQRNEETEDADFHALVKEDERGVRFKDICHRNPHTQRIIKRMLPKFDRKGLLELNQ